MKCAKCTAPLTPGTARRVAGLDYCAPCEPTPAAAPATPAPIYEYRFVRLSSEACGMMAVQDSINELAVEGWRLMPFRCWGDWGMMERPRG
jgi:hypothetical protein